MPSSEDESVTALALRAVVLPAFDSACSMSPVGLSTRRCPYDPSSVSTLSLHSPWTHSVRRTRTVGILIEHPDRDKIWALSGRH